MKKRILSLVLAGTMLFSSPAFTLKADAEDEAAMEQKLVCTAEEHSHDDSCYGGELTCGLAESEGHSHSDACKTLSCTLAEAEAHSHDDNCYSTEFTCTAEAHTHDENCTSETLSCTLEEHSHDDSCSQQKLTCTLEEGEGHAHDDSCYSACQLEEAEAHSHSAQCYALSCDKAEHQHEGTCYELVPVCTCGSEEEGAHAKKCPCYVDPCICDPVDGQHEEFCELYEAVVVDNKPATFNLLANNESSSPTQGSFGFDKTLIDNDDGDLAIRMEAFTVGTTTVVPTEIVMVVDQSGSMYTAVDSNEPYDAETNPGGYMTYEQFVELRQEEGGAHPGYYMVVTDNTRYNSTIVSQIEKAVNEGKTRAEAEAEFLKGTAMNTNGEYDVHRKYAVAMVRYNEETKQWQRSHQVATTELQYGKLDVNPTFKNFEGLGWQDLSTDQANYCKEGAKYFKTLYGATVDAYYTLLDEVKDIPNSKVAVVGFSSAKGLGNEWVPTKNADGREKIGYGGQNYGGTGIFVHNTKTNDMDFKHAIDLTDNYDYNSALIPTNTYIEDGNGRELLVSRAIEKLLSNYNQTSTEDGFLLANKIFEDSDKKNGYDVVSDPNCVNRAVVLFTDGVPTCTSEATLDNSGSNSEFWGQVWGKRKAIQAAYDTKNTYGATVYTYGQKALEEAGHKRFMEFMSSKYPTANWYEGTNEQEVTFPAVEGTYSGFAGNSEELRETFENLGKTLFESSQALNKDSVLKDVITPYFQIDTGSDAYNNGEIKVYKSPFVEAKTNADGTIEYIFDDAKREEITTEVELKKETVKYNAPEGENENFNGLDLEVVTVTNYDYVANCVNVNDRTGYKLQLEIPIKDSPDYLGGQHSNTNTKDSGILNGNDFVIEFEPPETDVDVDPTDKIDVTIEARAGSTFLEEIDKATLENFIDVKIGDVTLNLGEDYFGLDPWQTDHLNIEFDFYKDAECTKVLKDNELLDVRQNNTFYVKIWVWDKYNSDGSLNHTDRKEEDSVKDSINLTVYYPTFVFADRFLYYGQSLDLATRVWGDKMEATNYLYWYTNEEYKSLVNPDAVDKSVNPKGYTALPQQTINKEVCSYCKHTNDDSANVCAKCGKELASVVQEVPKVYFKVDPIDQTIPTEKKTNPVDEGFFQKFGNLMGKEPISMNVRVFYTNTKDPDYDPNDPPLENAMRNAFFLHVRNNTTIIPKHTSGSSTNDEVYWGAEFYIYPKTCTLTITKSFAEGTSAVSEPFVFDVYYKPEGSTETGDGTLYTQVTIEGAGSVTIEELPIGTYTIKENTDWSWRYKEQPVQTVTLEPNDKKDHATVTFNNEFNNEKDENKWLNNYSTVVKNIFGISHNTTPAVPEPQN